MNIVTIQDGKVGSKNRKKEPEVIEGEEGFEVEN
jgi:hypothetical protein